jgi:hypothetical protein
LPDLEERRVQGLCEASAPNPPVPLRNVTLKARLPGAVALGVASPRPA